MGCCTNILDLYDRLGVLGEIDWHETLWFARGGGAMDRLAIAPVLPAPLHYAPSFLRMRLFSLAEKLAISRAFLAILRMGPKGRVRWQGRAFGDFLAETRQPARVVELFWDPVVVSACNLPSAACEAAHAVIAAVPPDRLARLCSDTLRAADKRLANLGRFEFSSILGVHLALRRRVLEVPNLALAGRATHWLFAHDAPEGADFVQRIEAVVSAADGWIGLSEDDIEARVAADIAWAVRGLTRADIVWSRPVLERRATFASRPGIDAIRPRAASEAGDLGGGVANLFLAGEWTDTGWPSTMEGAARSGYSAAAACVGGSGACSELPAGSLVRLARGLA